MRQFCGPENKRNEQRQMKALTSQKKAQTQQSVVTKHAFAVDVMKHVKALRERRTVRDAYRRAVR